VTRICGLTAQYLVNMGNEALSDMGFQIAVIGPSAPCMADHCVSAAGECGRTCTLHPCGGVHLLEPCNDKLTEGTSMLFEDCSD